MRITDYLRRGGAAVNAPVYDRDSAIRYLIDLMNRNNCLWDSSVFEADILKRVSLGTTAIGMGIAIPHAKSDGVKELSLSMITVPQGIDFKSPDGLPVKIIFLIGASKSGKSHIDLLAQLMMLIMHLDVIENQMLQARSAQELIAMFDSFEYQKRSDWKSEPLEYEKEFSRKQNRRAYDNEPYPVSQSNQAAKKPIYEEAPRTKCGSCGSTWTATVAVAVCPFCGKPLKSVDQTDSPFLKLLIEIKNEFGLEIFNYPLKVKSILKDKAPGLKQDIRLFSIALDSGLYSDIHRQRGNQEYYTLLRKNSHILTDSFFLNETASSKITAWYCGLLDINEE